MDQDDLASLGKVVSSDPRLYPLYPKMPRWRLRESFLVFLESLPSVRRIKGIELCSIWICSVRRLCPTLAKAP
jgi:hypothetical protein